MQVEQTINKERIEYIDAMRGFTMILVVLCHVGGCLNIDNDSISFHTFFIEFRMPLFFFVSGFVLYKNNILWNLSHSVKFLHKKFYVQIVSTGIFLLTYCYVFKHDIINALRDEYKDGYWFTFVLFEFFVIYSLTRTIAYTLRLKSWVKDTFILCEGLFLFIITIPSVVTIIPITNEVKGLICFDHWYLFLFFVIGTLTKKHFVRIQYLFEQKTLLTICIVIFFGLNIFREAIMSAHINVFRLFTAITGIAIVFGFFWNHSKFFCHQTATGRGLCFIGRRTLDIYLLHYFLLPVNLSSVISVFHDYSMPIIELMVSLSITLVIIAICLLISTILRLSPFIGHLLFGVKLAK